MKDIQTCINIVKEQEALLRFESFDEQDALALGLAVVRVASAQYDKGVSVRIFYDGATVFSYHMKGASLGNDWWMDKKLNTSLRCGGISSLLALCEIQAGLRPEEEWQNKSGNYALSGGCFPIRLKDGTHVGYVMASALKSEEDHQLLCDAIASLLDIPIETVL